MRNSIKVLALAVLSALVFTGSVQAGVTFAVSAGPRGVNGFYLSLGEQYGVPQSRIQAIRSYRIVDEELPVVLFIAQKARISPLSVARLRHSGWTWLRIARYYRLASDAFYFGMVRPVGPYARAYGYYQTHPRSEWGRYRLSDSEIVDQVNLRFLTDRYGCRPEEVADWRSHGRRFVDIHEDLRARRVARTDRRYDHRYDRRDDRRADRDGGRDHGHERDHR